jgi:putative ABC transport system permease protein
MNAREVMRSSLQALAANKMRTALTMLGIIIGVAAVICAVAIGEGASHQVTQQISKLGSNLIFIEAGSVNRGGVHMGAEATKTLLPSDAVAIKREIPLIKAISPVVGTGAQVVYEGQNWFTHVRGIGADYYQITNWSIRRGAPITQEDVHDAANVCDIGQTVAKHLFGVEDPVGKVIRIGNLPFVVIGELRAKGLSPWGQDQDDTIMAPYSTLQKKIIGIYWVHFMMASAISSQAIQPAIQQITALLRLRHKLRPNQPNDFIIRSPQEFIQARMQAANTMALLLASIAAISLLVGGIGIMNIMLVSVTERRREIGVRRAVGATRRDVRWQFLSEAMVICLIGGAAGIVGGTVLSALVSGMLQWPTQIPFVAVVTAVGFSAAVGIFFGYYPAQKASQLDPIETLRYE